MHTRIDTFRPTHRAHAIRAAALAGMVALAATAISPLATFAQDAEPVSVNATSGDLGTYLVGPNEMTLYYFTRDVTPGVSVCNGGCADVWPPLLIEEGQAPVGGEGVDGTLGVAARADGSSQATYRGRPLYFFANDAAAGDTNGQDVGGVWFVATVDGSMPANPPALTLEASTSDLGTFLTGVDGLTIYFFVPDATPGVSACEGGCLDAWPPVTVSSGNTVAAGSGISGVLGTITGNDGSTQVTYDGRPLYYFANDEAAGDTNGQGVGDVWFVADVGGSLPTQ